jgi:hypothetical protein
VDKAVALPDNPETTRMRTKQTWNAHGAVAVPVFGPLIKSFRLLWTTMDTVTLLATSYLVTAQDASFYTAKLHLPFQEGHLAKVNAFSFPSAP